MKLMSSMVKRLLQHHVMWPFLRDGDSGDAGGTRHRHRAPHRDVPVG